MTRDDLPPQAVAALRDTAILIVDDQAFIRRLVVQSLSRLEDVTLHQATDGADAIQQLSALRVDAILLDINMRPINGLETLKAVRTGIGLTPRDLPVIMLTTVSDERAVNASIALDAHGFVLKPASAPILVRRLARSLAATIDLKPVDTYDAVPLPSLDDVPESPRARPDTAAPPPRAPVPRPEMPRLHPAAEPPAPPRRRPGDLTLHMAIDQLEPGDRVVDPLMTAKGTEILPAGTVLDATMVARLVDLGSMLGTGAITVERRA